MWKRGYIQAAHPCAPCLFKAVASFMFDSTTLRDRWEKLLSVPTLSWPISSPLSEASSTAPTFLDCWFTALHIVNHSHTKPEQIINLPSLAVIAHMACKLVKAVRLCTRLFFWYFQIWSDRHFGLLVVVFPSVNKQRLKHNIRTGNKLRMRHKRRFDGHVQMRRGRIFFFPLSKMWVNNSGVISLGFAIKAEIANGKNNCKERGKNRKIL